MTGGARCRGDAALIGSPVRGGVNDRGREGRLASASPPAKPDGRFSRIRLSSQWAIFMDWHASSWARSSEKSP